MCHIVDLLHVACRCGTYVLLLLPLLLLFIADVMRLVNVLVLVLLISFSRYGGIIIAEPRRLASTKVGWTSAMLSPEMLLLPHGW